MTQSSNPHHHHPPCTPKCSTSSLTGSPAVHGHSSSSVPRQSDGGHASSSSSGTRQLVSLAKTHHQPYSDPSLSLCAASSTHHLHHDHYYYHYRPRRIITSTTVPVTQLLDLPRDVLDLIVRHVTHRRHESPSYSSQHVVDATTYRAGLALARTCTFTRDLFYANLDDISLASSRLGDPVVRTLAQKCGPVLKRLVLRRATNITNLSLIALATYAGRLRCLDLSFIDTVDGHGLIPLCQAVGGQLRHLLLRKCKGIDDRALIQGVSKCRRLHTLDLSYCSYIKDVGMTTVVSGPSGKTLQLLAIAHCVHLSNASFYAIGLNCSRLRQLCARGLPAITNDAVPLLCNGLAKVGRSLEGVDITSCPRLTRDMTLRHLHAYCPKISHNLHVHASGGGGRSLCPDGNYMNRSLKQIIICTLRQNIFIVHGSDPDSGSDTVYTVLIDNGDLVSASLLSSGTTDLSTLGIVLCKSYGSTLSGETKQMLEEDYGIPLTSLAE